MHAMRCSLHRFRLALRTPLAAGAGVVRWREGFLLALTDGGSTGWGEASPLPGWSCTNSAHTEGRLHRAARLINTEGEPAFAAALTSLRRFPHARAALAGAAVDLRARRAGQPMAAHLIAGSVGRAADSRGSAVPTVAVNALIVAAEPYEVGRQARIAVQSGFTTVKLKVGAGDPASDISRVREARSALGPEPELRLDANGAWDWDTAVDVLGRVRRYGIAFCEEPVSGLRSIASVGRACGVAVAVDESMRSEADAVTALALGVRVLIVKPQALGGPDRSLAVSKRARDAGVSTVVTSFMDTAVGVAHALHVAAVIDTLNAVDMNAHLGSAASGHPQGSAASGHPHAHGLATSGLFSSDVATPIPVDAGVMRIPEVPGIGVTPWSFSCC